jgi:hypothetical protein
MSARAAWRLEGLGFGHVYDFAPSKAEWFANGLPREGKAAGVPWAGDVDRSNIPTGAPDERVGELRDRVAASDYDFCLVVNDQRIVLGRLRGDALAKDAAAPAEELMELGPKTIRPNHPVAELLTSQAFHGFKHWTVTTSHGVLHGVLLRADAERALE